MIKFFRKIRQNLLLEGKTGKYLKYAFGEVVLVMIGILLALQVNNWNELRKENKKEKLYLTQLFNEFKKDSTNLEWITGLAESKINQADTVIQLIKIKNSNLKDSISAVRNIFLIGKGTNFEPFLPTYEELVSSGQFAIIKNKQISDKIRAYVARMQVLDNFAFQENKQRKVTYNTHLYNYMSSEIMPLIWEYRNTLTFWKLAREKEMNIQGFLNDPESMIITQNVKSADMENTYLDRAVKVNHLGRIKVSSVNEVLKVDSFVV